METKGKLISAQRDIVTNKLNITFQIESTSLDEINRLSQIDKLLINADEYVERRSLNANAYFHVLVGKIAKAKLQSNAWAKNELICKYCQPEYVGGDIMVYKTNAPVEYMRELETLHTIPIKYDGDITFYKVYRGSRTYNRREMHQLIEGTVAEAKENGIETMPPEQLKELLSKWKA